MSAEAAPAPMEIEKLLANMEKVAASDLHLKAGSPPIYRINGIPQRIKANPLSNMQIGQMVENLLSPEQKSDLSGKGSVDFALSLPQIGRFRVNIFRQRGALSFCARRVRSAIPSIEELNLPKAIAKIPAIDDGLVLVAGATGSGKSSTLASLINRINTTRRCHILTIEDPIEFIYQDDKSFINQREIGLDAPDFHSALKYAMRQDPDVILVGEMRDSDTIETALAAGETGHLVFATLHANNAMQTLGRILDFFPGDRQSQLRQLLAFTLKAVVAQKLLPGTKPEIPRVPALELMFINPVIRRYIEEGEDAKIPESIRSFSKDGMQDFNMSLHGLIKQGLLSEEVALEHSPNPEQLRMHLKGLVLNQDQGV